MYRIWVESIWGFRLAGEALSIDPVLPEGWNDLELSYRHGEATYRIAIRRDPEAPRKEVRVNGKVVEGGAISLIRSSSKHEILVVLPGKRRLIQPDAHQDSARFVDALRQ